MKKNTAIAMGSAAGVVLLLFLSVVLLFVLTGPANTASPASEQLAMGDAAPGASAGSVGMEGSDTVSSGDLMPVEENPVPPVMPEANCDAFQSFVGKDVSEAESTLKSQNRTHRILKPGDAMTMDFSPERVNVEHEGGTVTRVFCG